MYESIRKTLSDYYFDVLPERVENIKNAVFDKMDTYDKENPGLSAYKLKEKLYDVIADTMEPMIFDELPFYFETGVLVAPSDGRYRHGLHIQHANAWLYLRNVHLFEAVDPEAFKLYNAAKRNALYAQTGVYVDIMHIGMPMKKVFTVGLSGVMKELQAVDMQQCDETEKEFIHCAMVGVSTLHKIALRFARKARSLGRHELADIAERVPWEAPKTLHEGLCAMAFMRKALGSLEGVGFNSFGRVDVLLQPLYLADKERGISDEVILEDISKFLLIWDCALDRRKKQEGGCDYELENTLTLGGCDENGEPVFNHVTRLFIQARDDLDLLYPKMMLRFSSKSPREYMELLAKPLVNGKSFSLLENDDMVIPAMMESGIDPADAYNYAVGGCWDLLTIEQSNKFSGEYLSIVRPLEWAIHQETELMEETQLMMEPLDNASDFEELYQTYLGSIKKLLMRKAEPMSVASREWHKVNPVCILSALMEPCIPKKRDLTNGGGKYNRECVYFSGFAEVVDSMLAIKHLCFDTKTCTVKELFEACRNNWSNEVLRQCAIHVPSYGDGSEEASRMAGRLYDDLYAISRGLPTAYGGEFRVGYNQYTEIIWWGKRIKALPNGRRDGEYISAGLTPSRLQKTVSLTEMLYSLRYMDMKKCAGNMSVTLSVPAGQRMETDTMIAILYAISKYHIQALQLNCVSLETLRRAQEEPENYGHVIVRVCGFSAPFVLLSPTYQEEFISRMLSEV